MSNISKMVIGILATAGACQSAFALDPTTASTVVGTQYELFLSGATASDAAIKNYVKNDLCAAGTYDIYQDVTNGGAKGANWFTMTCTMNSASPVPASLQGQNVVIHKRTKVGSIYGVYPVVLNSYNEFMNIKSDRGSGACTADGTALNTYNCAIVLASDPVNGGRRDLPRHSTNNPGGNIDECDYTTQAPANPVAPGAGLDTICRRVTLGTADVETEMFQANNMPNLPGDNFSYANISNLSGVTRSRLFGQVFGIAVSNGLWSAIQSAQGLSGAPATDGSNWPSLTKDQVRQVFSGQALTWTGVMAGATFTGTLNNIGICRREQGSGSQASANQFFLNYPCDTATAPKQATANVASGVFVKENLSSSAVKSCLNDIESAGANANPNLAAGGIGLLSYNAAPGGSDTWKWIKIDGAFPSLMNAIVGKYDFWTETQAMYNNSIAGTELDFATTLISELKSPSRLNVSSIKGIAGLQLNGTGPWDGLQTGSLVNFNNSAETDAFTVTLPVMGGHHGTLAGTGYPASGSPLSCRPIINYTDGTHAPNRL
jgi:hypothetical protein